MVACNLLHEIGNAEKGLNNVPCVAHSCIEMHATGKSWIAHRGWIFRASRCTLHSKWITLLTVDNALFEKTHAKITTLYFVPCVVWSCIEMHATRESWITYRGWIIRATSCTLHSKWITLLTVDNALFEKTHAKITALYIVPCVVPSCIKMHATRESVNCILRLNHSCNKLHATRESWTTH